MPIEVEEPETEVVERARAEGWAGALCRCSECGIVARCVDAFDFYVFGDPPRADSGDPLVCEVCFRERCRAAGLDTSRLPAVTDPRS